jgi:hypothetical protein
MPQDSYHLKPLVVAFGKRLSQDATLSAPP